MLSVNFGVLLEHFWNGNVYLQIFSSSLVLRAPRATQFTLFIDRIVCGCVYYRIAFSQNLYYQNKHTHTHTHHTSVKRVPSCSRCCRHTACHICLLPFYICTPPSLQKGMPLRMLAKTFHRENFVEWMKIEFFFLLPSLLCSVQLTL